MHCSDRQGLERALAVLLQDPTVGAVMTKFMSLPAKPSQGLTE